MLSLFCFIIANFIEEPLYLTNKQICYKIMPTEIIGNMFEDRE